MIERAVSWRRVFRLAPAITMFLWLFTAANAFAGAATVETAISAMEIKGRKPYEKLIIRDLDIFLENDTTRGLPLRRLLDKAGLVSQEVGDSLQFRSADGTSCMLWNAGAIFRYGSESQTVKIVFGVSDVTGLADYYVPESVIRKVLNAQMDWDEANYAFIGKTESTFPVWADYKSPGDKKSGSLQQLQSITVDLPEILPPARPSELGDPSIHFIQPSLIARQNSGDKLTTQKSLESRGRLLGGRYAVRARESTQPGASTIGLDNFSLTHRMGDLETTLGDVDVGFSDLVFPNAHLSGFQTNGLLGLDSAERAEDRSNFGRNDQYLSRTDIRGVAPLGSTVELFQGDRLLDEETVTEPGGVVGEGAYRFEGINLTRDRVTELRIVITETDGRKTERVEEYVGSNSLLQSGQSSFIAGAGTRRFTTPDLWKTQGQFYGARWVQGLTSFWTVGASGAFQDQFSVPFDLDITQTVGASADTFPKYSQHAGFETRLRLMKRLIFAGEVAASQAQISGGDSVASRQVNVTADSAYAYRLSLEAYPLSGLKIRPEVFRLSPGFFDGSNIKAHDRQGYAVTSRIQPYRGLALDLTHGDMHNNLKGRPGFSRHETWQHAAFNVPRFLPKSSFRVGLDRLTVDPSPQLIEQGDEGTWQMANVVMNSTLLRVFDLNGQITFGDERKGSSDRDLRRGMSLPNASVTFRRGWDLAAGRAFMANGWLTIGHSSSEYRRRSEVTHILRATSASPWQWRFDAGYDWLLDSPYLSLQPEYYFDRTGFSRISTLARYQDREWSFSIGIQLQPVFSLVGGRPFIIPHSRLNPSNGGVKGIVFFDHNGNGRRDRAEPGVGGVDVMADGKRATSGRNGEFVLAGSMNKRRVKVSLDPRTLSANYNATNGAQWANVEPGALTPVALGIVEPGSISGIVFGPDPQDLAKIKPIEGVRVVVRDSSGVVKQESFTFMDGTYFIGSLLPGDYEIDIDKATLPKGYGFSGEVRIVQVRGGDSGQLDVSEMNMQLSFSRPEPEEEKSK